MSKKITSPFCEIVFEVTEYKNIIQKTNFSCAALCYWFFFFMSVLSQSLLFEKKRGKKHPENWSLDILHPGPCNI